VIEYWRASAAPVCLALVVRARGSSYRRPGALALLDGAGFVAGTLSGGCLDEDIAVAARESLQAWRPRLLQLDTRSQEDLLFGSQSGCRGEIDIMLWPSTAQNPLPLLDALARADREHRHLRLRIWLAGPRVGELQIDQAPASGSIPADRAPIATDGNGQWAELDLPPTPRLLLVGGGPEAPALLHIARRWGWWVEVIEHRGRFLAGLTAADLVHAGRAEDCLPRLALTSFDAAICMTHLYAEDQCALALLAATDLPWIGLLGPRARRDALLVELGDRAASLAGRIEGPVGELLGGDGPEALALSIAARLQRLFNQR
jgi:xanthine dehydrogenase accessory factor